MPFEAGLDKPLFLIAGPCVIESEQLAMDTAGQLKEMCAALMVPLIYKSAFDKANRSSAKSFRGPGMEEGLRILAEVKKKIGVPVLTDVHEDTPLEEVASVVDVLQTPAFLYTGAVVLVEYRMHSTSGKWKIYDVIIEGVSLVNNYRSQFNNILMKSPYEELVQKIKGKAGKDET